MDKRRKENEKENSLYFIVCHADKYVVLRMYMGEAKGDYLDT